MRPLRKKCATSFNNKCSYYAPWQACLCLSPKPCTRQTLIPAYAKHQHIVPKGLSLPITHRGLARGPPRPSQAMHTTNYTVGEKPIQNSRVTWKDVSNRRQWNSRGDIHRSHNSCFYDIAYGANSREFATLCRLLITASKQQRPRRNRICFWTHFPTLRKNIKLKIRCTMSPLWRRTWHSKTKKSYTCTINHAQFWRKKQARWETSARR